MKLLEPHFFAEWKERVSEDGMFEDDEESTWKITVENCLEFIEAINIQEWVDEECLTKIIEEKGQTDKDGIKYLDFN